MTLQFILGTGNHDHQKAYIKEAEQWLQKSPEHQVFFLVPNYNKFEQEQEILSALKKIQKKQQFSTINAQVFSFYRLAWYFLQQTGWLAKDTLSEMGSTMIFQKILAEQKEHLTIYQGEVNKPGFIQQLTALYQEMQTGNITPVDFQTPTFTDEADDHALKFQDLQLIFQSYQQELGQRNLQVKDPLELLYQFFTSNDEQIVKQVPDLTKTMFVVSGYSVFGAQELQLLRTLMDKSQLLVSLILDRSYPGQEPSPLNLFRESGKSYFQLKQLANQGQVPVLFDLKAPQGELGAELQALETMWRQTQNQEPFAKVQLAGEQIHLWKAPTPQAEIQQIGNEIRKMMTANPRLRYRDIQLLTPNLQLYGQLIPYIFTELEIPYYIDQQFSMEQHPLAEFIQALFAIEKYHYRIQDIFRLLKTELFLPQKAESIQGWTVLNEHFRKQVDLCENVALENNFQGSFWTRANDWQIIKYNYDEAAFLATQQLEQVTNELRQLFREHVVSFLKGLKQAQTGTEALSQLYQFLLSSGVEQQLLNWRDHAIASGNLELARNHEQTWSTLMDLMDDYQQIYGQAAFDFAVFEQIFTAGLKNAQYGKVPTALDQVKVNQLNLARPNQVAVTFAIGLNETDFPAQADDHSLLTSEERQFLNDQFWETKFFRDLVKDGVSRAPFDAYKVFLSGSQQLYLSYAANYDTKQNIKISPYLTRLQQQLGLTLNERQLISPTSEVAPFIGSYRQLIGQLNTLYRLANDEKRALPSVWLQLEKILMNSPLANLAQQAFASRTHQNIPVPLTQPTARMLYGQDLYTSISRLENFYNCEYKHFANFGLRLKERQVFGLNPMVTGEFFHDALDQLFKVLIERDWFLQELADSQRESLVDELLLRLFGEERYAILNSSARLNYIRYQLKKTIQKVAWALQRQSQKSNLTPVQTEVLFGQIAGKQGIKGLEFPLSSGGKLFVRGKIDRVDMTTSENQTWISVVDYKSSQRKFDIVEAYYGLAMQLVTYLDVAMTDALALTGKEAVQAGGAYYLQVHNPILTPEKASEFDRLSKYQFDGLFIADEQLLPQLDTSLEPKARSAVFPVKMDKDGAVKSAAVNKFYSQTEISDLRQHNRAQMKKAGERVVTGQIALNPAYEGKERVACRYCPFRSVCGFDVMLPENNYHRLEKLDKKEIMKRIAEERDD